MMNHSVSILKGLLLASALLVALPPDSSAEPHQQAQSTQDPQDPQDPQEASQAPPAYPKELDGIPLPTTASGEATVELIEQLLPSKFRRNRCSSHVVYTDADWDSLTQIRNVLGRSWIEYRNFCRRMGVTVPRPDEKLVCIVFDQHEEFLTFAKQTEGDHAILEHSGGYFSPRFDWIVFFEPQNHDSAEEAYAKLEQQRSRIENRRAGIDLQNLPAEEAQRILDRWAWQDQEMQFAMENIEAWTDGRRTTVAIHEAVHQFTHVCHTWPGKDQWPVWLHEGMATSFETQNADQGFGPDQLNVDRDYQFISCLDEGRLMPLREFIALEGYGDQSKETLDVLYPQSYGLMTWLYEHRRSALTTFLKRLSAPPSEDGEQDAVVLFEEVFGDLDRLEKRWHGVEARDWRTRRH